MKALVLAVKGYDFKNDVGESVKGNKVYYLTSDKVEGILGNPPMCVNLQDASCFDGKKLPALFNMDFSMKPGKNNKPDIVLVGCDYVSDISFVTPDGEIYLGNL